MTTALVVPDSAVDTVTKVASESVGPNGRPLAGVRVLTPPCPHLPPGFTVAVIVGRTT